MAQSFRDLRVWQQAMDVIEEVYRATESFPKQESFGLVSQMRRAAVSVAAESLGYLRRESGSNLLQRCDQVGRSLAGLINSLSVCETSTLTQQTRTGQRPKAKGQRQPRAEFPVD